MENHRDLSPKDQIAFALDRWLSIQNVTGHNAVASVAVSSRYRDEPDRGPYPLYEGPAVELRNLLDADRAARIGRPPAEDDPVGQLGYAAARLRHVLRTQQVPWGDGLTYPGVSDPTITRL